MPKTLTLRLDDDTYRLFASAARAEDRSIASLIRSAALRHLHESQFVDEPEMREICDDEDLGDRLRRGSAEARARKGRFVD